VDFDTATTTPRLKCQFNIFYFSNILPIIVGSHFFSYNVFSIAADKPEVSAMMRRSNMSLIKGPREVEKQVEQRGCSAEEAQSPCNSQ
jgi:amino acid permease